MRYRKGSVIINEAQDVPLLLLVRNSGYIKHEQLLFLAGYDKSKASLTSFWLASTAPDFWRIHLAGRGTASRVTKSMQLPGRGWSN